MTAAEYKRSATVKAPTEEEECKWLWQWAQMTRWRDLKVSDVLVKVPNGAYHGNDRKAAAVIARKLREQGLQPGVFDYIVPVPKLVELKFCPGLWLEMKRTKGGVVSTDQTEFMDRMIALGWRCEIARGWIAAAKIVAEYLDLGEKK